MLSTTVFDVCVQALEKADEAKTGAVDSSQRVKTALNTVDDILSQLSKSCLSYWLVTY